MVWSPCMCNCVHYAEVQEDFRNELRSIPVPIMPSTTTQTMQLLTEIFCHNGLPDVIVSDSVSQFTSSQFQEFLKRLTIKHFCSPLHHTQSNGQAERFVDTFKRSLMKSKGQRTPVETLQNFPIVFRTTPSDMLP